MLVDLGGIWRVTLEIIFAMPCVSYRLGKCLLMDLIRIPKGDSFT
jgi:hypothetical protein